MERALDGGDAYLARRGSNVVGLCLHASVNKGKRFVEAGTVEDAGVRHASWQDTCSVFVDATPVFRRLDLWALFQGVRPSATSAAMLNVIVSRMRENAELLVYLQSQGKDTMFYVHYKSRFGKPPQQHVLWTPFPVVAAGYRKKSARCEFVVEGDAEVEPVRKKVRAALDEYTQSCKEGSKACAEALERIADEDLSSDSDSSEC